MKLELTIFELGQILKKLEKKYKLDLLVKSNLSGGWMTIKGQASIEKIPGLSLDCTSRGNNIIDIKVKDQVEQGATIKLTGAKDKKFILDISSARYKELSKNKCLSNEIKVNNNECKLRIDENMIFTIKASIDEIKNIIK
ncbi:UDP-N-acetylglucosamine pyrophosphorylase [Clostridium weizhouense]|uniref:UDP-N-acetylglucosamine pyrophosphorylase n=1 Tax=Clostridium weizhouense TaxID=2859781 RepID=A0ABS7ANC8_9CLOT|nr:UDP-N-acetylglucosamine pyrophosphorylase [Clostridium weizhouense]MBW6410059.1 UDP-N-acetylglucosamine pyrophosphorylase [Clostridium weizhouense]